MFPIALENSTESLIELNLNDISVLSDFQNRSITLQIENEEILTIISSENIDENTSLQKLKLSEVYYEEDDIYGSLVHLDLNLAKKAFENEEAYLLIDFYELILKNQGCLNQNENKLLNIIIILKEYFPVSIILSSFSGYTSIEFNFLFEKIDDIFETFKQLM